jgi:LmbE family N-acetylglucosaminyl deacetylase
MTGRRRFTVVSFHAHPDDEALLTAGTLARAAAEGHRVVLVTATAGEAGLTTGHHRDALGDRRVRELQVAARAIGAARVEVLGYADGAFSRVDPEVAASRLASILREERADVVTIYDRAGGYGHPDHVHVHRVGLRAAELAGTPVVLEATIDRTLFDRAVRILQHLSAVLPVPELPDLEHAYTARTDLTHCIDVRRQLRAKRGALHAHTSQAARGTGPRTLAVLLALPWPVSRLVLGREWFREVGRQPAYPLEDDIFASLRRPRQSGPWQAGQVNL